MKKIALTGNIGCGKSFVGNHLKKHGLLVFDCDVLAKEVREENIDEISAMFCIDASKTNELAKIVFAKDENRILLEKFLYPKIMDKLKTLFEIYKEEKLLFVEVPLLYEKKWDLYFDEVWVISVEENTALERLQKYRNMSKKDALLRLKKQMPLEEKRRRANVVIVNENIKDMEMQIHTLLKKEGVL